MSHERRGYKGGAAGTTLLGDLNDSSPNIPCVDLSSWAGVNTNGTATATINAGESDEEVVEFTGISGDTLTGCTRGAGGTLAQAHSSTAEVIHSAQVKDFDEPNELVAQAHTWTDSAVSSGIFGGLGSMTIAFTPSAQNHYRYIIVGKLCFIEFNQIVTMGGTLQNQYFVLLPVAAAHAHNAFAGTVEGVAGSIDTFDDVDRVYIRRYDVATLGVSTNHHTFCGFYEIA